MLERTPPRYVRLTPIASGGMASVWAARLAGPFDFAKTVALKVMLPELAAEPEYRTMFLDEGRIAARLHHPNLCETFELGEEQGELYLAMEWVDGVSVHRLLRGNGPVDTRPTAPLPLELAAKIVLDACAGLHAAHEATTGDGVPLAIVHRDVSPHNLLVSIEGVVKVADFGIAACRGKRHTTSTGQAKGKLAYMAPEQLRGRPVDRRADVHALGAVLYELTTGARPFEADTDVAIMRRVLETAPERPSLRCPGYPLDLERIVLRALSKSPDDRFASAEGLRLALERWLEIRPARGTSRDLAALVEARCGAEIAARADRIRAACHALDERPSAPAAFAERRSTRGLVYGLGALVVLLGAASVILQPSRPPVEPPTEAVVPTGPDTAIATTVTTRTDAEPTADAIGFRITPSSAELVVDGVALEPGAREVPRPRGVTPRIVLVKAPDHVDRLIVLDPTSPATVEVDLAPVPTPAPAFEPEVLSTR